MSILLQDVRFALRGMAHRPGFTAVILATLALGIGANAAIFSVVDAVLLRPLAFAHVDRIVDFTHTGISVSEPEFVDYQRGRHGAVEACRVQPSGGDTNGRRSSPFARAGTRVSADFFEILGVKPVLGRTFARDEFSHLAKGSIDRLSVSAMWRQQFAEDARIVGKTIQINGNPATIVGVMPAGVVLPDGGDTYWTRWRMNPDSLWTRNNHYLRLVGELKPGATVAQAQTQARTLNKQWMRDFPRRISRRIRSPPPSLRSRLSPRANAAVHARAPRRGVLHPSYRLRQRREPVARARRIATQRVCDSYRARRLGESRRSADAHGKHALRCIWRGARSRGRASRLARVCCSSPSWPCVAR